RIGHEGIIDAEFLKRLRRRKQSGHGQKKDRIGRGDRLACHWSRSLLHLNRGERNDLYAAAIVVPQRAGRRAARSAHLSAGVLDLEIPASRGQNIVDLETGGGVDCRRLGGGE